MNDIVEAISRHYGLAVQNLTELSGGFIHKVWRFDSQSGPLVAKLYRGAAWPAEQVTLTLENQRFASVHGHPVPGVVRDRQGNLAVLLENGCLTVSAFQEGVRREEHGVSVMDAVQAGTALGRLHRTLHALPVGGATPFVPETEATRAQSLRLLEAAQSRSGPDAMDTLAVEAALFRVEALKRHPIDPSLYRPEAYQVIHGDYHAANLLFGPTGQITAILDWDFSRPNWLPIEVGRAAVEMSLTPDGALDRERAIAFVNAYCAEHPLPREQRRSMFRMWWNYLLWSLYPLPLRYDAQAEMPRGWQELARRRHRLLLMLDRYIEELQEWCE